MPAHAMACAERTVALVLKVDQPQKGNKAGCANSNKSGNQSLMEFAQANGIFMPFIRFIPLILPFSSPPLGFGDRVWLKPTGFACPPSGDRISQKNSTANISPGPQLLQSEQAMNRPLDH